MWTKPEHITKWYFASDDWHAPSSTSDFKIGGKLNTRMEAKDGSFGFDFWGIYNDIKPNEKVGITIGDDRKWDTYFSVVDGGVKVIEEFEAENENPVEMQQEGWQMILNNFKKYAESH
jgi:uncharacterized protein YndB with AHSA1/START domain